MSTPFSNLFAPASPIPNFAGPAPAPIAAAPAPVAAPVAPSAVSAPPPTMPNFGQPVNAKPGWSQIAALIPALIAGIKDPVMAGAAVAGFHKGMDEKQARLETQQQTAERRANAQADFYDKAQTEASTFDDPIAFEHWRQAITPMAHLHGVDPSVFAFDNTKKAAKDRKLVSDALTVAEKQHGPDILNRDDVSIQLADGRTISMKTARQMVGGGVTDTAGTNVPVPSDVNTSTQRFVAVVKQPDGSTKQVYAFENPKTHVVTDATGKDITALIQPPDKEKSPGSIEEQMVAAQTAGDTATYDRLKKVHEEFAAAGRKGEPDPNGPKIPGDPTKTGDAYLQTLPPEMQQLVKHIADYKADVAKVTSLRGGEREQIAAMVMQYDPSFDMPQYASRAKLRTDFTSGKGAQNIRSLNTAVGHLATLKEKADALGNRSSPLWNSVANRAESAVGDPRVVAFNTAATAVEGELASLFKGTGAATDAEIKQWRASLDSSQSPAQQTAALETAIELMHSRLSALDAQYDQGMGKPRDFNILTPASRTILQKMGVNVDAFDPEQTTATAGGGAAPKTIRYDMNGKAIP